MTAPTSALPPPCWPASWPTEPPALRVRLGVVLGAGLIALSEPANTARVSLASPMRPIGALSVH